MAYNPRRVPMNPTSCGNHICELRKECGRYTTGPSATRINSFRPERRHGKALSCSYQTPKTKPKEKKRA